MQELIALGLIAGAAASPFETSKWHFEGKPHGWYVRSSHRWDSHSKNLPRVWTPSTLEHACCVVSIRLAKPVRYQPYSMGLLKKTALTDRIGMLLLPTLPALRCGRLLVATCRWFLASLISAARAATSAA